jgi:predicted SAM-dependent methyltransferase
MLTKQNLLKVINPILRGLVPNSLTNDLLAAKCRRHNIRYLDLGGRSACEGYLVIHLSPVEPYGLPLMPSQTQQLEEEDVANLKLRWRDLESPSVVLNYDLKGGIPLADGSMQGVNLSHILEHMSMDSGRLLLKECFRILRPGGLVRISCPDLKKYAAAYISSDQSFWHVMGKLPFCNYTDLPTSGAIFSGKAYDNHNGHLWFYDAETVIALLHEVGFQEAVERKVHESRLPSIEEIEPYFRAVESFYVEGQK